MLCGEKHGPSRGPRRPMVATVALVSLFALAAGCDGTAPGSFDDREQPGDRPGTGPGGKIDPDLEAAAAGGAEQEVIALLNVPEDFEGIDEVTRLVNLELGLERGKQQLQLRTDGLRIKTVESYRHLPAVHLRAPSAEALKALAAAPEVARLEPVRRFTTLETAGNLTLIKQPVVAAAGKQGAGATVAVLDTGTDFTRAPFGCSAPGGSCKVAFAADFAPDDKMPDDARAHGTNVAGTILAVAPAARIAALDVFDGSSASTNNILSAINWAIENRAKYNIVALNMSFGGGAFTSACSADALAVAIDRARSAGILALVASGNDAKANAMASPACSSKAISVGAVYHANMGRLQSSVCTDATSAADQVACFSNSTSFLSILAPGVSITAAGVTMSGTSQATPHVAGAVAVLRAAFPTESVEAIATRLTSSGVMVKDPRNGITKPRLNLEAAAKGTTVATPPPPAPPPPPPPPPPPTGTVTLNAGARYTRLASVAVAVPTTSGKATAVCVTTNTTCPAFQPMPSPATVLFTLPAGDGLKTVRVWWRDANGSVTAKPATATITLDTTAPVGGKLTLKLASNVATYTWTGVTDVGAGVASYKLLTRTEGPVPAGCTTGTTLWSGPLKTVTQAVLPGRTYYSRLCAIDNVGNVSAGIAGQFAVPAAVTTARK
jgi:subtilisin family serine protease